MSGLNPEPMQGYSIADRLVCDKCGVSPRIKSITGTEPLFISVSCHGEEEQKAIFKKDLLRVQYFFGRDTDNSVGAVESKG